MSVLFSSLNYRTPGLQGNPSEICKTLMAEDQPGWLLLSVEARKLGKSSCVSCLQVAGWISDKSSSFGNRAFECHSVRTLTAWPRIRSPGAVWWLPSHQLFLQGHSKQQLCCCRQPQLTYHTNVLKMVTVNILLYTLPEKPEEVRWKQIQPYTWQAVLHSFSAQPASSTVSHLQELLYHVITGKNLKVFLPLHTR